MIDEEALRLTLLAGFEHLKSHYQVLTAYGAEIAALRETVAGLDPTFNDVMAEKRLHYIDQAGATFSDAVAKYDLIISKLKSGRIVGNAL